jgi:hypothetical protein
MMNVVVNYRQILKLFNKSPSTAEDRPISGNGIDK